MGDNPHLEFQRRPSSKPHLNPVEWFWKKLRRRATHDRLSGLKSSLRASLRYFRNVRQKGKSIIGGRPKRKATK
ncbi:MAG TPA: hypothetical protein VGE74_23480 [Gemmata sp.]